MVAFSEAGLSVERLVDKRRTVQKKLGKKDPSVILFICALRRSLASWPSDPTSNAIALQSVFHSRSFYGRVFGASLTPSGFWIISFRQLELGNALICEHSAAAKRAEAQHSQPPMMIYDRAVMVAKRREIEIVPSLGL
ncbi:MAG: hypothetical protein AB1586_31815 [Pseudomonadota bacterium]